MEGSILYGKNNKYILDKRISYGGEGGVYSIQNDDKILAKIYFKVDCNIEKKILFMYNNQPDIQNLCFFAWPVDVLYDDVNKFVGFVMPKLNCNCELSKIYEYNINKNSITNYKNKIEIGISLCNLVNHLHSYGYVIGDFNPSNIGVDLETNNTYIFDVDSFHVYDKPNNILYRCGVGYDGYIAPELIKKVKGYNYSTCRLPTFTQETDLFALSIHIFRLLFNGFTPFNGIKDCLNPSTTSPATGNKAVESDNYCFKKGNKPLSIYVPNIDRFPRYISTIVEKSFVEGNTNPSVRPSAKEWMLALIRYKKELVQCELNRQHFYYKKNGYLCPYCEVENKNIIRCKPIANQFSSRIEYHCETKKKNKKVALICSASFVICLYFSLLIYFCIYLFSK